MKEQANICAYKKNISRINLTGGQRKSGITGKKYMTSSRQNMPELWSHTILMKNYTGDKTNRLRQF
jgi:hypothetical protein